MAVQYRTIPDFFSGRHVLITGATGFMGKVLLEKLLYSCPQVDTVYLLMRPKRGHDVARRIENLINLEIFDRLRKERPDFASHVVVVRGDVTLDGLGLNAEDYAKLVRNVDVVFHCAATVRFDQPLRTAAHMNTLGTRRVLDLATEMTQLQAFVHVSTSFCHCDQKEVKDILYPSPVEPEPLLQTLEWMSDDMVDFITPKLLGSMPNTYSYTKNLSENLIAKYSSRIPVGLARPSIVTAMWKEPIPGWVDNINGPTGLLVGAGKGVIRSMHCCGDYHADAVPVDVAVNGLLVLAWRVANVKPPSALVCNLVSGKETAVTWAQVLDMGRRHVRENPLSNGVWYPDGSIKRSRFVHNLCVIFFHFLPAYFIDVVVTLCGKKPFMVKVQRRVQGGLKLLQYYTTKEWLFSNDRFLELASLLTPEDSQVFYTDLRQLDWDSYTRDTVLGTRHYFLKEDPSNMPQARAHLKRLYYIHQIVTFLFYALLIWLVFSWSDTFLSFFGFLLTTLYDVFTPLVHVRADSDVSVDS